MKKIVIIFVFVNLFFLNIFTAQKPVIEEFEKVLILDSGRIKPLLTYSKYLLKGFSGKAKYEKLSSIEWFFKLSFDNKEVDRYRIFLVNNPMVLEAVGYKNNRGRDRYGFNELNKFFNELEYKAKMILKYRKKNPLSILDTGLINLYNNLKLFKTLKGCFLLKKENKKNNNILKIIPSKDDYYLKSINSIDDDYYLKLFSIIKQSYLNNDYKLLKVKLKEFNDRVLKELSGKINKIKIDSELIYDKLEPFYRSEIFYGLSLLMLIFSSLIRKKIYYLINISLLLIGFIFHLSGIILRIIITSRPPVTDLYESLVFTSIIAVILGIIYEVIKKNKAGLFTSSILGFLLLIIAGKFAPQGDTIGVLVAVLDSNFWLTTHVITITLGYAGIVFSGVVSHYYLYRKAFKSEDNKSIFDIIYSSQAFGLVFSVIGTVLGGIWADQSWGRFWGWDPKENGALLIILWSAIIFHSRLDGIIKKTGFAIGSIIGIVNVILAWFGINLLGVGLHSYGFTSGSMLLVVVLSLFEFIFIIVIKKIIKIKLI